ncbi:hypothetical protein CCP3SC1AL1_4240001 [Gammaproteobacteria bacterium]
MIQDLDWNEEDDELYRVLFPLVRNAAVAGAGGALEGLDAMGVGVDWGLVNQAVAAWARGYTYDLVRQINGTTRKFLQGEIPAWVESGDPLEALIETLKPMFGKVRAEMIAATEVTRAFAEGNLATWRVSGVVKGKRWYTAEDELVCPICGPLAGMEVGLDENGFTTEEGGEGLTAPPAHVNCRCWLQPVVGED